MVFSEKVNIFNVFHMLQQGNNFICIY